jgi:3-carboxy-cis,cis-muconate cycloisomerase
MRDGSRQIHTVLDETVTALDDLDGRYGSVHMMGRTNGQHALPITFGHKLGQWQTELVRRQQAIREAANRALVVQLGGAVGDLRAYPDGIGLKLRASLANTLGLESSDYHWQNSRDALFDLIQALGSLCASLCKIAHNINLLASSDIDELREGHSQGRGASSAMAHKKNQRSSEFAEALARLGRQRAEQMGELTLHVHERSGGVWIGEWILVPEVFILTSGALMWVQRLFSNLEIREQSMREKVVHV